MDEENETLYDVRGAIDQVGETQTTMLRKVLRVGISMVQSTLLNLPLLLIYITFHFFFLKNGIGHIISEEIDEILFILIEVNKTVTKILSLTHNMCVKELGYEFCDGQ